MTIYLIEYDLIHDIQRKMKTPLDVISSLLNSGKIIQSKIDIQAVGTLNEDIPSRIPFYILFASVIESDIVTALFDVDEKYVHIVTQEMFLTSPPETLSEPSFEAAPGKDTSTEKLPHVTFDTNIEKNSEKEIPEAHEFDSEPFSEPKMAESRQNKTAKSTAAQTHLRVNIDLLDSLMTLAGELVLSRNQLLQGIASDDARTLEISGQRIDMVTSELQEAIMKTRMQSISNVFNKFPRVVRDLSRKLNKEVSLSIEGKSVELDKTIIEAISDPLTHLVRNAVDHGIEIPDERHKIGKDPTGKIFLKAFHEAGQVNIEISDDGRGLDGDKLLVSALQKKLITDHQASVMSEKEKMALIFLPGFSTAKHVTDVSGRGVGMDVVKTNLDKLGGIVDIESKKNQGTVIR
ncbi:MAG: hybrid sensor histidine kinase/response regulator, partial [Deltaproteobacteria bacterium]|nr:hybrid sensor histidine kinase/response regulator [Deltaproteobacteria bacterium]